jgi:hypothetical protein
VKIIASDDLKGELVFGSINKSVRAGDSFAITRDQFAMPDIQAMLRRGSIRVEGTDIPNIEKESPSIGIQSNHTSKISFTTLTFEIAPDMVYWLTQDQFEQPDIQQALDLGLIEKLKSSPKKQSKKSSAKSKTRNSRSSKASTKKKTSSGVTKKYARSGESKAKSKTASNEKPSKSIKAVGKARAPVSDISGSNGPTYSDGVIELDVS